MFFYTKLKIIIILVLISSLGFCKKEKVNSSDSYESYIKENADLLCSKLLTCFTSITRTFPSELQKQVNIENCKKSILSDFDEKLSLHTETMKTLSKGCYEKLLIADCKDFLTFAYADTSCYMLRKESEAVYGKAIKEKKVQ